MDLIISLILTVFLSTPSVWRWGLRSAPPPHPRISIHALLAESDSKKQQKIGSFVAELAILPLQYALSLDLSKYFRRYSSVFEKLFGAKVPEF